MAKGFKIDVTRMAYALYKQDWVNGHTNSEMRLDAIRNYYGHLIDCQKNNLGYISFEDYLEEYGYNGQIYSCYEEFCSNEYRDEEYICKLLDVPELIEMYLDSLKQ